jgi:Uma2 family endonuclease
VIHLKVVIAGALAGIGGVLTALAVGHIDPEMAYWTTSGGFVFVTILAGTGSVIAPFLGSLLFEGAHHAAAVQKLTQLLVVALGVPGRAAIRVQLPLALGEDSEPEPDVAAVVSGSYKDGHPTSALLVIEVAESSLAEDRREKGVLYAEHGIPEYWIVDTARERVEVHSEIIEAAYSRVTPYRRGEVVASSVFTDLKVRVEDIFD